MKGLFERPMDVTAKALDCRLERQNLVMGNLANADTPGYKARRLEFEDQMQKALDLDATGRMTRTNPMHMPVEFDPNGFRGEGLKAFKPRTIYGEDAVDLDKETVVMAKNSMMYNALTTVLKKNFQGLSAVISEGSK